MCGPAALATALGASGVAVHPDQLAPTVYLPERRGTLQVELLAAARRHGRLAVRLPQTLQAVVAQIEAGRPVLVLQNLASRLVPVWHYAVVVGYHPENDRFVLRSGRDRRRLAGRGRFRATWDRAGNWAVVLVDPAASPRELPPANYLQAAADLESTGAHALALEAFRGAARAWPEQATAHLGEANNLYFLGRVDEAAAAYRRLLGRHPDHEVAIHNLATLLLEQGRNCDAAAVVAAARGQEGPLLDAVRRQLAAAPCADPAGF